MNKTESPLSKEEQIEGLVHLSFYQILQSKGIDRYSNNLGRDLLNVSRSEVVAYLKAHPEDAEALVLKDRGSRFFHDVTYLEKRDEKYVIYGMDRGNEIHHYWYENLFDAASDFVAFHFGYGYPDGYALKKSK